MSASLTSITRDIDIINTRFISCISNKRYFFYNLYQHMRIPGMESMTEKAKKTAVPLINKKTAVFS